MGTHRMGLAVPALSPPCLPLSCINVAEETRREEVAADNGDESETSRTNMCFTKEQRRWRSP